MHGTFSLHLQTCGHFEAWDKGHKDAEGSCNQPHLWTHRSFSKLKKRQRNDHPTIPSALPGLQFLGVNLLSRDVPSVS
jgi:hypothetical protein